MSASTMPTEWPLGGQGDSQVGGDGRFADAALARRHEEWPRLRTGLGERNGPSFGVSVRLALSGRRSRIAVQTLTKLLAVGVGHHGELEIDAGHAVERSDRLRDASRDLVAQRASGDREGDQDPDPAVVVQVDVAEHPEIDDRSVQLRVLDRTERIDDLLAA